MLYKFDAKIRPRADLLLKNLLVLIGATASGMNTLNRGVNKLFLSCHSQEISDFGTRKRSQIDSVAIRELYCTIQWVWNIGSSFGT